jgi:hypothetical protein
MAQGDVVFFDQFLVDSLEGLHDLENDTIKVGLTDGSVTTPSATTADPRWGAGGTTNLASEEVTPGGNYASGGAAAANPAVTLTGGLAQFDADDVSWAQNASNPTDATWAIIYNDTDAGKRAIGYVDIGGVFDMTTGNLSITWNANGIGRLNQA